MNKKKRKRHLATMELNPKIIFKRCLAFTALFCLICFFIVPVVSYFLYKTKDPTSHIQNAGVSLLFISVFLTSFIQSKINKQHYLLSSLILGILIFALTLMISLIIPNNEFNITNFVWRLLIPVFSILGGMLGISRNDKRRKHH